MQQPKGASLAARLRIKPEQLAAAIRKELESYSKAATEETKELIRETAKICKEEIQSASPVRTGKYRKGWSIKPLWEDNDSLREIVRNRSAWQLTTSWKTVTQRKTAGACRRTRTSNSPKKERLNVL